MYIIIYLVSSQQNLRESRISSKDSDISKRPSWNSKTKIDVSPLKTSELTPQKIDKTKTKPPIPKILKSPPKTKEELNQIQKEKKIQGGTKFPQADNNQNKPNPISVNSYSTYENENKQHTQKE